MAERKQVNKYYPPDWDPRKGGANKRVGQHPLRDRAKKLSQGILVIRFELPYNIWCGGCGSHVGMGVRYNAEKSKVGNYYSTPIYKFRMKCHLCDNYFEIQTDPQNHDYVILSGARRKEQRWDPSENGQIVPEDKATQKKMATDAMYKLEHGSDDKEKGKDKKVNLARLEESRISMVDDYILNRMARDKFRAEKKILKEAADADAAILERGSLDIELVEENEEDIKVAGLIKYTATTSFEDKQKEKRKKIEMRPLFETSKSISASSDNDVLPYQRHTSVNLSRRGEIKQKLGAALRANYNDPFNSTKFKSKGGISVQADGKGSLLGIKLKAKSPAQVKQSNPEKSSDTEKDLVSQSKLYTNNSHSSLSDNETKTDASAVSLNNNSQKSNCDILVPACGPNGQSETDDQSPFISCDTRLSENDFESNLQVTDKVVKHNNDSSECVASNDASNRRTSTGGLLTLMSSYTEDSDSGSDVS